MDATISAVRQLSVAQAAAVINVVIVVVRLSYPLLISVVAAGLLKRTTNAATWSVFGRLINNSHWPVILRTDVVSATKVDKRVQGMSYLNVLAAVVLGVAAAITPLGLHSTLRQQHSDGVPFSYVKDDSPIGQATQQRGDYTMNRVCGDTVIESCPGNDDGYDVVFNETGMYSIARPGANDWITTDIAANITDTFASASEGDMRTVAGLSDIQYRSYIDYNNQTRPDEDENTQWLDEGRPRTQGQFRYYQQFILDSKVQAIEGLIISTGDHPGIGFRNHTLPPTSQSGYTWTEQILWLEPETACTNLNITFDYTMPAPNQFGGVPNARITDRGGLVDLPADYPILDLNNTQDNPQLLERSWKGAIMTNIILARAMNETRSNMTMGKTYPLADYAQFSSNSDASPNQISFSGYGSANTALGMFAPQLPGALSSISTQSNSSTFGAESTYFSIATAVRGYGGADPLNISTIAAAGGLLMGEGSMLDSEGNIVTDITSYRLDPGTNWTQPIFSCTAAVKASVKTVVFQVNGTAQVSNLVVESVENPSYNSTDSMPIWAMEMPSPPRNISQLSPFWGPVLASNRDNPDITTLQRPNFYLPAGASAVFGSLSSLDALAGAEAPFGVFGPLFTPGGSLFSSSSSTMADYSGATSWPLFMKWNALGRSADTAGKIVDYIWTDLMANAVVSSKSALPSTDAAMVPRPATRFVLSTSYDWKYAVPALVFAAIYILLFLGSALMMITRKAGFGSMRFVLNQTAAGRAMTTERYQASGEADRGNTKLWAETRGDEPMRLNKEDANGVVTAEMPYQYDTVDTKQSSQVFAGNARD